MQKQEIEVKVIAALKEMTQDWDLDTAEEIGRETGLINDLEFESIDIVQLAVALEQSFGQKGLPFEQLFMREALLLESPEVSQAVAALAALAANFLTGGRRAQTRYRF